jgi:integrase/recombinase XerD
MPESIHNYEKRLESALRKVRRSSISKRNKELIFKFRDECFSIGLSVGRVIKYIYYLIKLSHWLGMDFEKAKKEDIKRLVTEIEKCSYADITKMELKTCVKKVYKWLRDSEDYPPEVKWIKPGSKKIPRIKLPDELLTEDDVIKLINATQNVRNKAFVSMLYETGCRIGEILFVRFKHISSDQYGAQVLVDGKTGRRRIRIISSVPYLTEWINKHPQKENPGAYVWRGPQDKVLSYGAATRILETLAQKARIKKKVNPHNFRHSRATYLANHLTEAQMKEYFGWVRASDMAAVYVHLSGRDVDNAILKVYGMNQNDNGKDETPLKPKNCPRCAETNPPTNKFCFKCGMPLDRQTIVDLVEKDLQRKEADKLLDELIKDHEFREVLIRKIKEIRKVRDRKAPKHSYSEIQTIV